MFVPKQKYEDNPSAKDNIVQTGNPDSRATESTEQTSGCTVDHSTPVQRCDPGSNSQKLTHVERCVAINLSTTQELPGKPDLAPANNTRIEKLSLNKLVSEIT